MKEENADEQVKVKEKIDTLAGVELFDYRRCGNSTRQINAAVEYLFKGYVVTVLDHWEQGRHIQANKDLFRRILDRLHTEHHLKYLMDNERIKIDKSKFTIELL